MKRSQKRFILLSLLSFIVVIGISISYFHVLNNKFSVEIYRYLDEVSTKNAQIIKTKIQDEMKTLKILSTYIGKDAVHDEEEVLADLNQVAKRGNFKQLAIADINGNCQTNDGETIDISDMDYFKSAMQGDTVISDTLIDQQDQQTINVYSTPVYVDNSIQGVLLGVQDTSAITEMVMSINLYEDSFTAVTDEKGSVVLNSDAKQAKKHKQGLDRQYIDVKNNRDHIVLYDSKSRGIAYLVSSAPLGINEWYIVSFVPASYAAQRSHEFNTLASIAVCFITLVIIFLLLFVGRDRKKKRQEKEKLLFYDEIADGYNFNWYQTHADKYREKMKGTVWQIAIQISDFRLLNQMYGYPCGDHMLLIIGKCLRTCDWLFCGVRKENDCFIGICEQNDIQQLHTHLSDLLLNIKNASLQECGIPDVSLQSGFAEWRAEEVMFTAIDKAKYAMRSGNLTSFITCYEPVMDEALLEEKKLEAKMEAALLHGEFKVYMQPKVDIETGCIVAAEALIRWQDPELGLISPGRFIPLFEKNGFLEQIDFYTCGVVCQHLKYWEDSGITDVPVSFNVSPTYIFKDKFVARLNAIVQQYGTTASCLEVEITETAFSNNTERLVEIIQDIHAMGIRIAMDDFGSGYSSLNMLKEIPVDTLKIDQGFFVQNEAYREKSESIVRLIMDMANQLHMEIVVEGIETETQLTAIKGVGKPIVQGFYFYKPMPIEEFERKLWQERNL